jgi:hypothetical protein
VRRAAAVLVAALAVLGASTGAAAAAEPRPVEEIEMQLVKTVRGHVHYLQLRVYPSKGLAIVDTAIEEADYSDGRGVDYAVAFPGAPFEGSLDLSLPGLGSFDGTISPKEKGASECRSDVATEPGVFKGHLDFRGAGGYESWKASRLVASVTRSCGPVEAETATPEDLQLAVQEGGPPLSGPAPFRFFAVQQEPSIRFIAWSSSNRSVQFFASDSEWRAGEVAVRRWANCFAASPGRAIDIGPGGDKPATVDFRPPKPFFGTGHYDRRAKTLTGSLGVSFLGRRIHLVRPELTVLLEDEEVAVH